ncbi:MAG: branched-chain amino acid ABC transporter permease [Clostridiales bacterium]|nr:branched-chain amino acid ABC transporter permease [Clostridiales bacterium]
MIVMPTMAVFLQQFCNALLLGSLFALVSVGYTMVYGILRLINFAHCDIFMMAMYIAYNLIAVALLPWYVAFIIVILATALLGIVVEKVAYAPLRKQNAPKISMLISAIGVSYFLENLATVVFTGRPKTFPQIDLFVAGLTIGPVKTLRLCIIVPVVTAAIMVLLLLLINHTKSGMAMRAISKDLDTSKLMGINVNKTISFTFGVGSAIAAVGAILWGLKYNQITPTLGIMPGFKCFIAAVIGGIGNVKGAVIGGLLLGFIEVMAVTFIPSLTGYKDVFSFILLIIVLLYKPNGILGEKIAEKV